MSRAPGGRVAVLGTAAAAIAGGEAAEGAGGDGDACFSTGTSHGKSMDLHGNSMGF